MSLPNYPNNPTIGQTFVLLNGTVMKYDGEKWKALSSADNSLRSQLAAPDSDVVIAGVEANRVALKSNLRVIPSDYNSDFALAVTDIQADLIRGQIINLPAGETLSAEAFINKAQICGDAKGSVLKAAPGSPQALKLGRHLPDWDFHKLSGFTIDGNAKASDGIDYEELVVAGGPQFAGRWVHDCMTFQNSKVGVNHRLGNIGNRYTNCHYRFNDIGASHIDDPDSNMHSGAQIYDGCEFSSNALAAVYIKDSQEGAGQYISRQSIIEGNSGFGWFMDLEGTVPFCGNTIDYTWFEANAISGSVTIDGDTYTPRDIYLKGVYMMEFRGLYLKNIELIDSHVTAYNCRIDDAAGAVNVILNNSTLKVYDVISNGLTNGNPLIMSIAKNARKTNVTVNHSWRGPLSLYKQPLNKGSVVYKNNFDAAGPFAFVGTASVNAVSVADGVIHDTCAELTIATGQTLLTATGVATGAATANKWVAWTGHFKLVSGTIATADFGGGSGERFGVCYLRQGEWVRSYGVAQVRPDSAAAVSRLRFINSSGANAVVRMADVAVVEFNTEREALEFANNHAALK